jgi:1,4-dihydroxy-6-naphthoate synthase
VDLGAWWEAESGLPIPLGAIVADHRLGPHRIREIDETLRESVRFARANPRASRRYVLQHAQEMSPDVVEAHIALYVNDFTESLGEEGMRAVEELFRRAESSGILRP